MRGPGRAFIALVPVLLVAATIVATRTGAAGAQGGGGDGTEVHASGTARSFDEPSGDELSGPVVALAPTPTGDGYWTTDPAGAVAAHGDAAFEGSAAGLDLWEPMVGLAATPTGRGYWMVAADGGVFTYGDARFHGSAGDIDLWAPIVGLAATPTGRGYWMVAADGGVFTYGDARFHGSAGDIPLVAPIVGMAATRTGQGYWLVAADGGVFTFGDARFHGSGVVDHAELRSAVGIAAPDGGGYLLAGSDGSVVRYHGDGDPEQVSGPIDRFVAQAIAAHPRSAGWWVAGRAVTDEVVVWQARGLDPAVREQAIDAARRAGAAWTVTHGGNVDVTGATRGAQQVVDVTPGWRLSLSARAVDPEAYAPFLGPVASVLAEGDLVVGARAADRLDLAVGDAVSLIGWDGRAATRRVGAIGTPAQVGDYELTFSTESAASIGFVRESAVRIWGFRSRAAIEAATDREVGGRYVAVDVSWRPTGRDAVMSTARLKDELGEFELDPVGSSAILQEPAWYVANLVVADLPILGPMRCHRRIVDDLTGALGELEDSGLAHLVDVADTRRNGGCYNARRIRGESGGAVSRHSWGAALDLNPSSNPAGQAPNMDRRVVEVFRSWGFAWGGTWVLPDGHHFEWVAPGRS